MRRAGFVTVAICLPKEGLNGSRILKSAVATLVALLRSSPHHCSHMLWTTTRDVSSQNTSFEALPDCCYMIGGLCFHVDQRRMMRSIACRCKHFRYGMRSFHD